MRQDQILLTSTDNIPHSKIEQHFGVVDSQIVIGANIFRDVFSSFRDIFGGETKGYKKDLDKMKRAAFSELKKQANDLGANAIICLRLDLDEVSGGGKSMFMLNAYGTAVKLEKSFLVKEKVKSIVDEVSIEDIQYYRERNIIKKKIENAKEIAEEVNLYKITEYDLWDHNAAKSVLKYLEKHDWNYEDNFIINLKNNFSSIPVEAVEDFLKDAIHKLHSKFWNLIFDSLKDKNWFNYDFLNELLQDENYIKRFRALRLCMLQKTSYQREEIEKLEKLGNYLHSDFDTTVKSREVGKMIGSKNVYTCPHCLTDAPMEKDKNCECGRNQFGLKGSSTTPEFIANYFLETAEAMKSAFSQYN